MVELKVIQIGDSLGVILPRDVLARLKLGKGDTVYLTDSANGVNLTAYDPEFDAQMTEAQRIMKKRRETLRELAK